MAGRALGAIALAVQAGAFALFGGTPQIVSHVRLAGHNVLEIVQRRTANGPPVLHYVSNEREPLHLVLVRDDFRSFSHLHPPMLSDGVFRTHVALDAGHRFYAFVASQPVGASKQVFRFVLQAGAPPHHLDTTIAAPQTSSQAGPYPVRLQRAVLGSAPQTLAVYSRYRAALHTVLINTQTLTYAHVDGTLSSGKTCCTYTLQLPRLARGVYEMWTQFGRGGTALTARFTLAVR